MKKNMNKILAVALAVTMLALIGVSATLAWLYDEETAIVNTWTVGKVYIELSEETPRELHIIPCTTEDKEADVTVEQGSEDCFVYLEVVEGLGVFASTGKTLKYYADYTVGAEW